MATYNGNTSISKLAKQYQEAMDAANAKNEERYQAILSGYLSQETQARSTLEGLGVQEGADIATQYAGLQSRSGQDMVSRGLTGTTIAPTMRSGIQRQETDAQGRLASRLKREKLAILPNLQSQRLNFMERREDVQPDYNQLIQLAQMQGTAGGGDPAIGTIMPGGGVWVGKGGSMISAPATIGGRKISRGGWSGRNDLRGGLSSVERSRNARNLNLQRNKRLGLGNISYDVQGDRGAGSLSSYLKQL